MKKSFLVVLCFAALIGSSLAFTNDSKDRIYQNLKVLPKDISKPQLDSVMKSFTAALGVKCNFCHVRNEANTEWNFPADDNKHKRIAREMMKMTNKINDKYFDVAGSSKNLNTALMVTCYTCHNGKKEPLTVPQAQEESKQAAGK